jgi:4-amino-4-deoxy-L-arabinose transferase-like glycosyltransferase
MLALAFSLLLGLALIGVGYPVVFGLDRKTLLSEAERLLCALLIGSLLLHLSVSAVGHLKLDSYSMGGVGLVFLLAALPGLRTIGWKNLADALRHLPRIELALLLAVCAVSYLQGLAPPNDYDSLMYHLAVPKADLERGFIAPDWERGLSNSFFPHLATGLVRFVMALAGEAATQPTIGLLGLAAIAGTGLLATRMGASLRISLWAALMFASVRAVVWEIASVEVDLPLAATTVCALLVYLAARPKPCWRMLVLFGLLLGIGFSMKYQGGLIAISFAPLLLLDLLRKRVSFWALSLTGLVALATFAPHMLENYLATGNPIFPLYQSRLFPGSAEFYDNYHLGYGIGRGFADMIVESWLLFAAPMQYFDGMVLGSPYLLALLPGAFIGWRRLQHGAAVMSIMLAYYVLWFFMQSQQVRFLIPVLPMMTALAALGSGFLWEACRHTFLKRALAAALFVGLFLNQSLFVGIYAALRLPAAIGLMSPADYHARTPTLQGASYFVCNYVTEHLKPGERYVSALGVWMEPTYYCPQMATHLDLPSETVRDWLWAKPRYPIDFPQFVRLAEEAQIRFVVAPTSGENRRNDTGVAVPVGVDLGGTRLGPFFAPAIEGLTPVFAEKYFAVYDGGQVLERLRVLLQSGDYPQDLR